MLTKHHPILTYANPQEWLNIWSRSNCCERRDKCGLLITDERGTH